MYSYKNRQNSVEELQTVQRSDIHVEEHPVQYRHGDLAEDWSRKDTETNSGANDKYDSPILFIHEGQNGAAYGRDGSWVLLHFL